MRKICVINNKGGVGKTTTAISLSAGLSRNGKKVLLVDLDPQSNVNASLRAGAEYTLVDVLAGKVPLNGAVVNLGKNLDVVTSDKDLQLIEQQLAQQEQPKEILKHALKNPGAYDYIIVDCPSSMGLLNQAALHYCEEAFIPTSTDFLGFDALTRTISLIERAQRQGSDIKITRIVPTMFDKRNKICKETLAEMQNEHAELTTYPIRNNSKLKEAPKHGKSIFAYAKSSPGAKDYGKLVEDVLAMEVMMMA